MFTSITKTEERGSVKALYDWDPYKKGILYLECEKGDATSYFLSSGVPNAKLFPVNRCEKICESIFSETGVKAEACLIEDKLKTLYSSWEGEERLFSCAWMDRMAKRVDTPSLKMALEMADVVKVTLSLRGSEAEAVICEFEGAVKEAGGCIASRPTPYKGASGVTNMVKFTVFKAELPNKKKDAVGGKRSVESRKKNSSPSLLGRVVHVPLNKWGCRRPGGYESVMRVKDCLAFRLVSKYRKTRYNLKAVMKDGRVHKKTEKWTLAEVEASLFLSE